MSEREVPFLKPPVIAQVMNLEAQVIFQDLFCEFDGFPIVIIPDGHKHLEHIFIDDNLFTAIINKGSTYLEVFSLEHLDKSKKSPD